MGDDSKSSVNWGQLGKNMLAGAAIVAGVMIVAPGAIPAVITALSSAATAAGAAFTTTGAATATAGTTTGVLAGAETWLASGIGALITKAVGIVAAVAGATYLLSDSKDTSDEGVGYRREEQESFAAREDMRKMQAVMIARMQAAGYQPAMALANGRGR